MRWYSHQFSSCLRTIFFHQNLSYTKHIYFYDIKVDQLKVVKLRWWWLTFFFLQIMLFRDRWGICSIFFLLSLPRLLKWPLRWECDVTSFMDVELFSSFLAVSASKYIPELVQTIVVFRFCFLLLPSPRANGFSWITVHPTFQKARIVHHWSSCFNSSTCNTD